MTRAAHRFRPTKSDGARLSDAATPNVCLHQHNYLQGATGRREKHEDGKKGTEETDGRGQGEARSGRDAAGGGRAYVERDKGLGAAEDEKQVDNSHWKIRDDDFWQLGEIVPIYKF